MTLYPFTPAPGLRLHIGATSDMFMTSTSPLSSKKAEKSRRNCLPRSLSGGCASSFRLHGVTGAAWLEGARRWAPGLHREPDRKVTHQRHNAARDKSRIHRPAARRAKHRSTGETDVGHVLTPRQRSAKKFSLFSCPKTPHNSVLKEIADGRTPRPSGNAE